MQKWAGGSMCHHSTYPEAKFYTALAGDNLTGIKVETKNLKASFSFSPSPENPYLLLHSGNCSHSVCCDSLVQLKFPIFFLKVSEPLFPL